MFSAEIRKLLIEVITSWQVLAVTGVLVVYLFLVNYVARLYHRRRPSPLPKVKKNMPEASDAPETDELGLEEDVKKE